jgi:hypothetical protein
MIPLQDILGRKDGVAMMQGATCAPNALKRQRSANRMNRLIKFPCGGKAHLGKTIFGSHIVSCGRCHAQSAPCASEELAAKMWNRFSQKTQSLLAENATLKKALELAVGNLKTLHIPVSVEDYMQKAGELND